MPFFRRQEYECEAPRAGIWQERHELNDGFVALGRQTLLDTGRRFVQERDVCTVTLSILDNQS
jgi:hypothetical protein